MKGNVRLSLDQSAAQSELVEANRSTHCSEPDKLATRLAPDADRYLKVTDSLCPACVADGDHESMVVPMVVYEEEGEIRLAKECE
ncbi:MAG: radical SAM protein, partial [Halodesulfurarchaeum sp.]